MNKNLPVLIIGIVLIAAIIGGGALYMNQSPAKPAANTNSTQGQDAVKKFQESVAKAPPGAQPAQSKGDPKAVVHLEEFADFACPTCGAFHQTLKEIEKTYGSKVRVTFRHFPLVSVKGHENAYNASRATEAAGMQGRFWEMQNLIFTNQKVWQPQTEADAKTTFEGYAKAIGIDVEKFKQDMVGQQATARVSDDMKRANGLAINSTPTVILNGNRLLNSDEILKVDVLRAAIEAELQKAQSQSGAPAANAVPNANK